MRGRKARRRKGRPEHGYCMCGQKMDMLTDGYFWCCACGRLFERRTPEKWRFVKPRSIKKVEAK